MPHILVVEDDPDIAALIAHYLENAGHRVDPSTSAVPTSCHGLARRRPMS